MRLTDGEDDAIRATQYYNHDIIPFALQQRRISATVLTALARLFVRHQAQRNFGIVLIHRHNENPPNHVLVHHYPDADTDICVKKELGKQKLDPCLFYCRNKEEFLPYEYNARNEGAHLPLPTEQFLKELAEFLYEHSLDRILGLSRHSPSGAKWVETSSLDGQETVAHRQFNPLADADGIVTEWEFVVKNEGATAQAIRACEDTEGGGHMRK